MNNLKPQQSPANLYFELFQRKQKSNCYESDVKVVMDKISFVRPSESFCKENPNHLIRTNRIVRMKVFLSSFNQNNARTLIKVPFFVNFVWDRRIMNMIFMKNFRTFSHYHSTE